MAVNLQDLFFANPEDFHFNELLEASRDRFLLPHEITMLMHILYELPLTEVVPPLTEGLYRCDSDIYEDDNNWTVVGPGEAVTQSFTMRVHGQVVFNYTEASLVINGVHFIRRTIRRREDYQLRTIVHYLAF